MAWGIMSLLFRKADSKRELFSSWARHQNAEDGNIKNSLSQVLESYATSEAHL